MKSYIHCISMLLIFLIAFDANAQKKKETKSTAYDYQGPLYGNRARVKQGLKWGFTDKNGSIVIALKYNEVENFVNGLAKVRKGHFWGLVDSTGKEIVPIAFDWVGDFEGDRAKVTSKGQKAYIDRTGKIVARE